MIPSGDGRTPHIGALGVLRATLGAWFVGVEIGAFYSGVHRRDGDSSVAQRGPELHLLVGRAFWLGD